jgi:hypothetical protein
MALHALLALVLAAQTPSAAAEPPSVFGGIWSGTAKLNVGPDTAPCRYTPPEDARAVTVRLDGTGSAGSVSLDLPASGEPCPAFRQEYKVVGAHQAGNSLALTDDEGHEWNLTLKEGRLKGLVSGTNLSGEFDLAATTEAEPAPGAAPTAAASPAPAKAAGGSFLKGTGGVIAANVVGLGALVGLNQALKDTQQSTNATTCSPRTCTVIGTDCNCNGSQVEGGSCGTTAAGVQYGGVCGPSLPCRATLSCNNGICDDVRCPVALGPVTRH